jgi:hypothetical protein
MFAMRVVAFSQGCFFFVPFMFLVSVLLQRVGWLRYSMIITCATLLAAAVCRALAVFVPHGGTAVTMISISQALNAIVGPVTSAIPSLLSATWFPDGERTVATSLVLCASNLGSALGFLLGPCASPFVPLASLLLRSVDSAEWADGVDLLGMPVFLIATSIKTALLCVRDRFRRTYSRLLHADDEWSRRRRWHSFLIDRRVRPHAHRHWRRRRRRRR